MTRPLILISNDDGINASGLDFLAEAMSHLGEVVIAAPHLERSATSHSITISSPLRVLKQPDRSYSSSVYSITGNPADCVMLALDKLIRRPPDLIITGINRGPNLGTDTLYSGTVGAAMEGAMNGHRAIAMSALGHYGDRFHYDTAASIATMIVENRDCLPWQPNTIFNINVPALPIESIKGIVSATVGRMRYGNFFMENADPNGRPYYWLSAASRDFDDIAGSDCVLTDAGYVTLSPLRATFYASDLEKELSSALATLPSPLLKSRLGSEPTPIYHP